MAAAMRPRSPVYYCDSEQNSTCSTPFVSAPSSPTSSQRKKNPNLYYYFSAPSSPPRRSESRSSPPTSSSSQQPPPPPPQRAFPFAECEFQFQSRFESPRASSASQQISGFYFSAPTSPDRKTGGGCSYWTEMPGTPKMIFGGGGSGGGTVVDVAGDGSAASVMESPDFEFSSSRMSESDSTVFSAQMSSADELFFKGQLLPLKLRPRANHHTWGGGNRGGGDNAGALTSSDSSGSSQTMGSSSCASAPQSPTGGRKPSSSTSPTRIKSAVMGSICGSPKVASASSSKGRFFSPLHFFRRYQSMLLSSSSSSRNSAGSSSSSPDEVSSSKKKRGSLVPRPARSSSRGRTLKELLHLSSVHKKNKQQQQQRVPQPVEEPAAAAPPPPASEETNKDAARRSPSPRKKATHGPPLGFDHKRRLVDRSLVGDYSKKFNQHQRSPAKARAGAPPPGSAAAASRRRFHSGSILDLHYNYHQVPGPVPLGGKRFHSGSIVPESEPGLVPKSGPLGFEKKLAAPGVASRQRMYYSGPILDKAAAGGSSASSSGSSGGGSRRFSGVVAASGSGDGSAPPSRSVSPRRAATAHELHYGKRASAAEQELRRRTSFLPYKQGLLGCLGCATMRIAGLSTVAATSAGTAAPRVH